MKGFGDVYKSAKKKNKKPKFSQEQIISQAIKLHLKGNILEATKNYQKLISEGCNDHRVFSNYGIILQSLGKLEDAELSTRKAIEIKPNLAEVHLNLGSILKGLGKLEDAELSTRKAIEIKPDYAMSHYNLANILKGLGKLEDAELSTRKAIAIKPDYAEAHSNLGSILRDLGKSEEAELSYRKAIEIKPDYAISHYNLGLILSEVGKLKEAELSYRKAIKLDPDFARASYSLSLLKYSEDRIWQDHLFSESFLNKKLPKEQVDIYFARANILHKKRNYKESSKCLKLANNIKLNLNPFKTDALINKSITLLIESDKKEINKKEHKNSSENIFIVGMPRSGSTLLESILSMNNDVYDLGEINILEEAFLEYKKSKQDVNLAELYWNKVKKIKGQINITINKWLYNYHYAGIICNQIPNAKIIHCFRNPLDNILSIYRAHFLNGNEYSSSLIDCAKVYLDQEDVMNKYKTRFRAKIYDLNYDLLVSNPDQEIKSLVSWLGWQWNDSYLSPHLNKRTISTASSVQVRSPINSKSIGGWKNYKEMLKPAIEILTKTNRYQNLIS
ncbi:tetratricopeptide repeat protein [Prochlorococcus sp. AH-736-K21]|nr:tetratricopeptide repeat protein [Prochlorococcus sp. AH-736-K21]MDA9707363.1 tetratricopeptide repeat protein [Prochlorococcus sp. AH-736-K21]